MKIGNDPNWPDYVLRYFRNNDNKGRSNSNIRRRSRGCRPGLRNRLRKRAHHLPLPSILLVSDWSLENKLDDPRAPKVPKGHTGLQYHTFNIICLTETWLTRWSQTTLFNQRSSSQYTAQTEQRNPGNQEEVVCDFWWTTAGVIAGTLSPSPISACLIWSTDTVKRFHWTAWCSCQLPG